MGKNKADDTLVISKKKIIEIFKACGWNNADKWINWKISKLKEKLEELADLDEKGEIKKEPKDPVLAELLGDILSKIDDDGIDSIGIVEKIEKKEKVKEKEKKAAKKKIKEREEEEDEDEDASEVEEDQDDEEESKDEDDEPKRKKGKKMKDKKTRSTKRDKETNRPLKGKKDKKSEKLKAKKKKSRSRDEDEDEEDEEEKPSKKNKKKNKKKDKEEKSDKKSKKDKKKPKREPGTRMRDKFGLVKDSKNSILFSVISRKWRSMAELRELAGLPDNIGYYEILNKKTEDGHLEKEDGKYRLLKYKN